MLLATQTVVPFAANVMKGHYGPTADEVASDTMAQFDAALADDANYTPVADHEVYAALCGDGRLNTDGARFSSGYFAFGGSYLPVMAEALLNPDFIIENNLKLDTHAQLRFRARVAENPALKFVWHTAADAPEDGIGCGMLAGRQAVFARIADGELDDFIEAGKKLGLVTGHPHNLAHNAKRLLAAGYLEVPMANLRRLPEDIAEMGVEEMLVGAHNEKRFLVVHGAPKRLDTARLVAHFNGWQAFITDAAGLTREAADWAKVIGTEADAHLDSMGVLTIAGITTLGNENLAAIVVE